MIDRTDKPLIFISYSHRDAKWLKYIQSFLAPAVKHNALTTWVDQKMVGGAQWRSDIETQLNACDICILLISNNSLSSDFILDIEMTMLTRRESEGAHIYPIVVTPSVTKHAEWVAAMNLRPRDGKALSLFPRNARDMVMAEIATEIADIAAEIKKVREDNPRLEGHRLKPDLEPINRPDDAIAALPEIDPEVFFVGREDLLRDFHASLRGILLKPGKKQRDATGTEVRAIWLDGPGGMGKSSFLRRACLEAHEQAVSTLKVGLVDFDLRKPDWHQPGPARLSDPRDLFNAVAYRLAKLYGADSLAPYWKARAAVDDAWAQHVQLHRQLEDALQHIEVDPEAGNGANLQSEGTLRPLAKRDAAQAERIKWAENYLKEKGLWLADKSETRSNIIELQRKLQRFDQPIDDIYASFISYFAIGVSTEITRPCRVLAETLQQCLQQLCRTSPLVLALDTCEDIPRRIENWLRYLFVPLLDGRSNLLILVGSQHRPVAWLDQIERLRFRNAHFSLSREGRFNLADIEKALKLAGISLAEAPHLPAMLLRITAGMPVALAPMIDLFKEDPRMRLDELDQGQADDPDDDRARETAIRLVAERLIRRLKEQSDEQKAFHDIIALTLMRNADSEILAKFWAPTDPRAKLRELEERYTLLTGGNIHPDIRRFVRAHWRQEPPTQLVSVVRKLLSIIDLVLAEEAQIPERRIPLQIERLNLLLWQSGEEAYPEVARCLVSTMASDNSYSEIIDLALELRPVRRRWREARVLLQQNRRSPSTDYWSNELLSWVNSQAHGWSETENASLKLLLALNRTEEKKYEEAVANFEASLRYFALNPPLPLQETVVESYARAVVALGQQRVDVAERAVRLLELVGVKRDDDWDEDYYWLLHDAAMYKEAEEYCRRAFNHDPADDRSRVFLAHLLGVHLDRPDEAVALLTQGLELESDNPNFYYFLASLYEKQNKYSQAEEAYKKTLDNVFLRKERSRILAELANLYMRYLSRPADARSTLAESISLAGDDADAHRKISYVFLCDGDFTNAEKHAREAIKLDSELTNVHNLGRILLRGGKWGEAKIHLTQWLTKTTGAYVREYWSAILPTLRDLVAQGHAIDMITLFQRREDDPILRSIGLALSAAALHPGDPPPVVNAKDQQLITELEKQLVMVDFDVESAIWPDAAN